MNPIPQFQQVLSRQAVVTSFRKAIVVSPASCCSVVGASSSYWSAAREQMPKEKEQEEEQDHYEKNGHLLVDHLNYIHNMLDHTIKMENTLERLNSTNAKKHLAYKTRIANKDDELLDVLSRQAAAEKEELTKQLGGLKNMMKRVQNETAYYAVNGGAGDGVSDADRFVNDKEEAEVGDRIIDYASNLEDTKVVERKHKL
ncbi:unnamed protein product [Cylindrotheca closterium]|uniref:Uncharacterized protein n=2 Tax=Cylindrotheca closterium TaxID=2856 RepID=A0AAD2GAN5_9STRA|nr:unnamed protein product [Cylindrotheca closterium]